MTFKKGEYVRHPNAEVDARWGLGIFVVMRLKLSGVSTCYMGQLSIRAYEILDVQS